MLNIAVQISIYQLMNFLLDAIQQQSHFQTVHTKETQNIWDQNSQTL
jgi:hypothetical protein